MEKNVFVILLLLVILFLNVVTSLFYHNLYTTGGWLIAFLVTSRHMLLQFDINRINRWVGKHNQGDSVQNEINKMNEKNDKT